MKTITKVNPFHKSFSKVDQTTEVIKNKDDSTTFIITRMTFKGDVDFRTEVKLIDKTNAENPYENFVWRGPNQNVHELNLSNRGYSTLKFYSSKAKAIGSIKKLMQSLDYRGLNMQIQLGKEDKGYFFVGLYS